MFSIITLIEKEAAVIRKLLAKEGSKASHLLPKASSIYLPSTAPVKHLLSATTEKHLLTTVAVKPSLLISPSSFCTSFVSSIALTLCTEFGDRTFFISGLLALKHPKMVVFTASVAALVTQTLLSTAIGRMCHYLPTRLSSIPLDDYAGAILLFVFGCLHAKEFFECREQPESKPENGYVESLDDLTPSTTDDHEIETLEKVSQPVNNTNLWRSIYGMIFVAEFGDKSMFSTIALATAQDPLGVFLGSSAAHALITLSAVLSGFFLKGYITESAVNGIGAVLFFALSGIAFIEGISRQGIF